MAVTETGHLASREIDDLYRAHVAEVYRYTLAVLGNHADAEDVTQTTFLNAYRALEQGVKPRKPSNWLLTIASNAIKQRFRQEQSRPRQVELDDRIPHAGTQDDEGPSVGELLTALSKIPPQQRQAIVLREFEGRSYAEIAEILGVTTSALETLLFRARRSLADELEHQLTCTEAQLAISQSVDDRLGRKEKRRLRDHLSECPDCASFARLQQRHRSALRGLTLVPIPVSLALFKGFEGTATAAVVPIGAAGAGAGAVAVGAGAGSGATAAGTGGGILAGGLGLKVAAVVTAAGVAGGVGVAGSSEIGKKPAKSNRPDAQQTGQRLGQVAPRGVSVPGNGVARGKPSAPGQTKTKLSLAERRARAQAQRAKAQKAKAAARGRTVSAQKRNTAVEKRTTKSTPNRAAKATRARGTPTTKAPRKTPAAAGTTQSTETAQQPAPPPAEAETPTAEAPTATQPGAETTAGLNGPPTEKTGGPKDK
jgi:RNA polymerase sigma factor (sigma-70 family)